MGAPTSVVDGLFKLRLKGKIFHFDRWKFRGYSGPLHNRVHRWKCDCGFELSIPIRYVPPFYEADLLITSDHSCPIEEVRRVMCE